ncbi:hypothetical protein FZEAL_8335 [Fusarium zealandicum]|uniref:Thioesterase domain-containing protein n=1 Tax=Fusarium zealandicum TaxID=1053134 RepID=A0A8H4UEQ0_9HYPO|nr:hypothetical protein FZEAL_8335 [Fusarium zealandicum]
MEKSVDELRRHFESTPWCADLLRSSETVTFIPASHSPPDNSGGSNSKDRLFKHTLNTQDAIPACLGFYQRPTETEASAGEQKPRLLLSSASLLFDLQPGVSGFQGTVHGGLFGALMDEAMGSFIYVTYRLQAQERARGKLPENVIDLDKINYVTAGINLKLKRPVPVPHVVVVKATLTELSGRKLVLRTTIEGEGGVQYAVCDGTWISIPAERL